MNGRFAPEADSSIDWAAGIEEIRQSPFDNILMEATPSP
jgi:hypothetical protein